MTFIDYLIVVVYLIGMVAVGFYFQRKASSSIDSFFLGNNKIPWWALGASGMASNLDVSGTMINVAILYAFGAAGFFIEIRGGIVLVMAFFMIFMGKWNRRAQVMTMAEWMELRFGNTVEGRAARLITAVATLLSTVAIVAYFAVGAGKFAVEILDIPSAFGLQPEFIASLIIIGLAMIYTVASGLHGVVWTDVFQGFLIFISIVVVCYIAFTQFTLPETFDISIPMNDGSFLSIPTNANEWTSIIPNWTLNFPEDSSYSIYNLFGLAILFYLIKVIIEGSGGMGGYMAQRFFAAKSDREAALLSLFWTFLLSFRWPFIAAITMMGIVLGSNTGRAIEDPENVLPIVIIEIVPWGIRGLLVAGLVAAAMSTFDSLVNAGASYWVKDIYQLVINPNADEKKLVSQSRWSTVIIVLSGILFTFNISSLNDIWGWLTMGIGAGLIIPLLIRWYWWRLNGYGFAAGVAAGMITAIMLRAIYPDAPEYISFLSVSLISLIGTIICTLLTEPTSDSILFNFYSITKPFGFWGKIKTKIPNDERIAISKENSKDKLGILIAIPWQLILFLTGIVFILKRWDYFLILLVLLILLSISLYFVWYKYLSTDVRK
jgi:SSS family solute:Na+ symporter